MSKQTAEHHCKAAEHFEHAAHHHHTKAANNHEAGSHQKATHHARLAHGYHHHATRLANSVRLFALTLVLMIFGLDARAQEPEISNKLQGFDAYIEQVLKDWNTPGIGVGIVVNDRLVFAKGYGYRDYEKKLPFTPTTLCQIASNSKLFTAVAAGMLVEEGKLTWDKPVRESVPTIQFYNDQLNNNVTLRDMLSHRTGVTRHDLIWFKSDFSRKDLFERLKYLEPQEPMREAFLYNNLMFSAAGYIIELKSGKTWEQFVRERILAPLDMKSTTYTISEMVQHPDHGVPFREKRDSFELYKIPFYEDTEGVAPAGAIISNIEELSHWLIALMNDGKYNGKQVLPASVLKATLQPAIGLPNIKGLQFRTPQFSDSIYEFVMENGQVKALKERDPSGEYSFPRQ